MKYNHYSKRDAIKNYFPMPNEIFDLGLRAGEIALYAFLLKCEDRKTFKCWPSYKTICKALSISKNTVFRMKTLLNISSQKKAMIMVILLIL